jgi:hypothetical protein
VSAVSGPDSFLAEAMAEIAAQASDLQGSDRLAPGCVVDLDRRFAAIAADPDRLAREVEAGALSVPQSYRWRHGAVAPSSGPVSGSSQGLRRLARGAARRSISAARRVAGPRLRSLERQTLDRGGRAAESVFTRGQVTAEHARRLASSGGRSSRVDRVSPAGRSLPAPAPRTRGQSGSAAIGSDTPSLGASLVADWVLERIGRGPGGRVLHVECGEGALVRKMAALGYEVAGADPAAPPSEGIARAGALECLGAERRSSLDALILSGATEEVTPASARALAHLASRRLRAGGVVALVSCHPATHAESDPISSDLAVRHPLHPVTWCHLLAHYGFGEITVFDPSDSQPSGSQPSDSQPSEAPHTVAGGQLYGVAARLAGGNR